MKILLINSNTSQVVTDKVAAGARAVASPGTEILAVCGEFGARVMGPRSEEALGHHSTIALAAKHAAGCDAVVIAVSYDTGLRGARELLDIPVVGMTEAALLTACMLGGKIGLVTFGARVRPLYEELVASYGLSTRIAGWRTVESVAAYRPGSDDELEALGLLSVADFSARFGSQAAYLPSISWDPTNSLYWDAFQKDIVKPGSSQTGSVGWEPQPDPPRGLLPAFKLSDAELATFRTNGFVVSERLSDKSFGDIYYNIFVRDLPVFITTDSILQAWQRSFSGVLEVIEEGMLAPTLKNLLWELAQQCGSARRDYTSGPLAQSFEDAEFYLSVAWVLAA